jgi:hypothetical protein
MSQQTFACLQRKLHACMQSLEREREREREPNFKANPERKESDCYRGKLRATDRRRRREELGIRKKICDVVTSCLPMIVMKLWYRRGGWMDGWMVECRWSKDSAGEDDVARC